MGFAYLASQPNGATLRLHGKGGSSGVGVVLRSGDEPGLALVDKHGKERMQLFVDAMQSNLSLYDENGKKRIALFTTLEGSALAMLGKEKGGVELLELPTRPDLVFRDSTGKVIWRAP